MSRSLGLGRLLRVLSRPIRRFPGSGRYSVRPYRGYARASEAFLMGRVFRQPGTPVDRSGRGWRRYLKATYRRLFRRGARGARVRATLDGREETVTTDRDGYFRVHWRGLALGHGDSPWHAVDVALLDRSGAVATRSPGEVYLPPAEGEYLVISDIDDTVVHTGVANFLVMMRQLFFRPAESRVAFPGVGAFYRGLHAGASGGAGNPMIFVSRAPWSIYEVLEEFFQLHRIPCGPILFLREWGLTLQSPLPRRARDHKRSLIDHVMDLYAGWPVVLIGDSGQHDPELYAGIAARHPGRVRAIYIRDVSNTAEREASIGTLIEQAGAAGAAMILADATSAMARHAADAGLIARDVLPAVDQDAAHDAAVAE